jgi:hypothetical protein
MTSKIAPLYLHCPAFDSRFCSLCSVTLCFSFLGVSDNSDIIGCSMVTKDKPAKIRRYLAIDAVQLIVVEPHPRKLGWGVAKFVGFLQVQQTQSSKMETLSNELK